MKKKKALLFSIILFGLLLFIGRDSIYAQTGSQAEDDPGYWKANGYYQEEIDAEEYTDTKFASRNPWAEIKLGIDVSKFNGAIDWNRAKVAGIQYAIIRVGYRGYGAAGNMAEDPYFRQNIEGALAAGIPVGVYMFSQAITEAEAIAEANYILERIRPYNITLPVVMDYEYTGANGTDGRLYQANLSVQAATNICKAFLSTVENAGYTPMLYANKSMLTYDLDARQIEQDYCIWLAHYTTMTDYQGIFDFWQYTSQGDGYRYGMQSKYVDLNYWYYDASICGPVYRIDYVLNNGVNNAKNPSTYRNREVALESPKREGYLFRGWYTEENFKNQIKVIEKGTQKDYTLYAKWEKLIKPESVKINKTNVELLKGKTYTLKATVTPTNVTTKGVTWSSSNEKVAKVDKNGKVTAIGYGSATITATAKGDSTMKVTSKVVVPYTIKYVLDEGKNSSKNPSTYYNKEVTLQKPTKSGYAFKGWYTDKTFKNKITKIEKGSKKNYTLYAKWQKLVSIKNAEITLAKTNYTYNGNTKKPAVEAVYKGKTLTLDKDYVVSYKDNKNIGTATVTITGKGVFKNSVTKTFRIEAKKGKVFTYGKYKYKVMGTSTVAFAGIEDEKVTKVEIPKTVKYGGKTFTVTAIGKEALKKQTKVTSVVISSEVKTIGDSAFEECKNLKTITIHSTKLKTVGTNVFKKINSKANIQVKSEKYNEYKVLLKGKGQGSNVKIVKIK